MKVTKINGLGSFGVYVDDFDYSSVEAWKELERLNLKYLVTILRGGGTDRFLDITKGIHYLCKVRHLPAAKLIEKYGQQWSNPDALDDDDRLAHFGRPNMVVTEPGGGGWTRISGEKNSKGDVLGMFADTELLWHSNGSGDSVFAPLVMLYGKRSMMGSSTGFAVTADWFDEQGEDFKSELEELIVIHEWTPHAIEPTGSAVHEAMLKPNFADWGPTEMPLVMTSPGGYKGLHIGAGTFTKFKGMSTEESEKIMTRIRKELFVPKWTKDLWWSAEQGDLYMFDNSITLHNRTFQPGTNITEALEKRLGYRTAGDYVSLPDWKPTTREPWASQRMERLQFHTDLAEFFEFIVLMDKMFKCCANITETEEYQANLNAARPGIVDKIWDLQSAYPGRPGEYIKEIYNRFNIQ